MKTILNVIKDHHEILRGDKTLSGGYPWITPGAILALEDLLHNKKKTYRVLDMGSGGSTIFFSHRVKDVITLETDEEWAKNVRESVGDNVAMLLGSRRELLKSIESFENESFDIALADIGPTYRTRYHLMMASLPKIKKGGWLVLDNYDQQLFRGFDYSGWDTYTFDMFSYAGRGTRLCKKL